MHLHTHQHELVTFILDHIAHEKNKSFERIKNLLLIKQNNALNRQFWEILDQIIPEHSYQYVGCCPECGSFELREQLPEVVSWPYGC